MGNRMTVRIFCLLAAFLGGCGGDAVGIFSAINAETKLNSDPSAPGNILSIVQYRGSLYAAGGKIYHKKDYTKEGNWSESSKPKGLIVRLAAGYSEDEEKEYLYALTAKTDSKGSTEYELWYTSGEPKDWKWNSIETENLRTIFSNNAASVTNSPQKNRAYATTSEGVFELNGNVARQITLQMVAEGVYSVADNGDAVAPCIAAAYIGSGEGGTTYFADTAAFASDGTYWFRGNDKTISYSNTSSEQGSQTIPDISYTIMSLWAHKTERDTGTLYIGVKYGGVKQVTYTVDDGTLTFGNAEYLGNAYATLGNYDVPVVFATPESNEDRTAKAVYASTVGTTATQGTKKNGLWGYYPGGRETWDRE